jgi:HD superfamily phosphodiesterase
LINHSHRVFFWANEMGRQTGQKFDVELVFICAAFHDFGLLKKFSSATDRFEVDGANAVRQFNESFNGDGTVVSYLNNVRRTIMKLRQWH